MLCHTIIFYFLEFTATDITIPRTGSRHTTDPDSAHFGDDDSCLSHNVHLSKAAKKLKLSKKTKTAIRRAAID